MSINECALLIIYLCLVITLGILIDCVDVFITYFCPIEEERSTPIYITKELYK